jgi:hypothetical protein
MDAVLPPTIELGDTVYVRKDLAGKPQEMSLERWYTVRELSDITGWPKNTLLAAIRRHELTAKAPNGGVRYRRVKWADYLDWMGRME